MKTSNIRTLRTTTLALAPQDGAQGSADKVSPDLREKARGAGYNLDASGGGVLGGDILTSDGSPLGGGYPVLPAGLPLGDGHLLGDLNMVASSTLIQGDDTACMK